MNRKLTTFDLLVFRYNGAIIGLCKAVTIGAILAAAACCLFGRVGI